MKPLFFMEGKMSFNPFNEGQFGKIKPRFNFFLKGIDLAIVIQSEEERGELSSSLTFS